MSSSPLTIYLDQFNTYINMLSRLSIVSAESAVGIILKCEQPKKKTCPFFFSIWF